MKKYKLSLTIFMLIIFNVTFQGCKTFDDHYRQEWTEYGMSFRFPIHEYGTSDIYPIHKNPRVGDYSILSDTNVCYLKRTITGIENNRIEISEFPKVENQYAPSILRMKYNSKYYRQINIDKNGNVINSHIININNNNKELIKKMFSPSIVVKDDNNNYTIQTKLGDFVCNLSYCIIIINGENHYIIFFKNDEVKFNIVRSYVLSSDEFEKFKLLSIQDKSKYSPTLYSKNRFFEIVEQGTK